MGATEQKRLQTAFYDDKYADARRVAHKLGHPVFRYYEDRLLRQAELPARMGSVLELGCGQGGDSILLSERADLVVGVDISCSGTALARRIAQERYGRSNVRFAAVEGERLPFQDDAFDVVYCRDALHHVSDPPQVVREVRRVLKPGGRFVAIEANPLNPQMALIGLVFFRVDKGVFTNTRSRLSRLLSGAGLRRVRIVATEYFPRAILFYYVSPLNRIPGISKRTGWCERFERFMDRLRIFRPFANYLVLTAIK